MDIVEKQFRRRKGLVRVAVKSMDHIKEKRIAMIEATVAVSAVKREGLERTDWSSIAEGDEGRIHFAQAWDLELEGDVTKPGSEWRAVGNPRANCVAHNRSPTKRMKYCCAH